VHSDFSFLKLDLIISKGNEKQWTAKCQLQKQDEDDLNGDGKIIRQAGSI